MATRSRGDAAERAAGSVVAAGAKLSASVSRSGSTRARDPADPWGTSGIGRLLSKVGQQPAPTTSESLEGEESPTGQHPSELSGATQDGEGGSLRRRQSDQEEDGCSYPFGSAELPRYEENRVVEHHRKDFDGDPGPPSRARSEKAEHQPRLQEAAGVAEQAERRCRREPAEVVSVESRNPRVRLSRADLKSLEPLRDQLKRRQTPQDPRKRGTDESAGEEKHQKEEKQSAGESGRGNRSRKMEPEKRRADSDHGNRALR